jgi:hypothetical protein
VWLKILLASVRNFKMARRVDITQLDFNNPQSMQVLEQFQNQFTELEHKLQQQQTVIDLQGQNQDITETLKHVGLNVAAQTAVSTINTYQGKPTELSYWLSQIEKHVYLSMGRNDLECRKAAYRCSRGTVSEYIRSNLDQDPNQTWAEFKVEMRKRFGEQVDPQTLLMRLRGFTQRSNQSVQVFAEVINARALEIFADEINGAFTQRELVSIFAKGIRSKTVARRLLERNPATLEQAATIASQLAEQQSRIFAFGLGPEPMEVNAIQQGASKGNYQNKSNSQNKNWSKNTTKSKHQYQWKDNKPICWKCNKVGHMGRDCTSKPQSVAEISQKETWEENQSN